MTGTLWLSHLKPRILPNFGLLTSHAYYTNEYKLTLLVKNLKCISATKQSQFLEQF